jgi:transcription factor IIIB 90 kDa subunit
MPDQIVQDIEDILRNPTEVAQKEAIFNKINKDYIALQAQKEKNRENAEQTAVERDEELIAQAKGLERYRKRKNRGAGGGGGDMNDSDPATTEEALLLAVANRKISRKINYDAMSAIFDTDGTFSTTEEVLPQRDDEASMMDL